MIEGLKEYTPFGTKPIVGLRMDAFDLPRFVLSVVFDLVQLNRLWLQRHFVQQ